MDGPGISSPLPFRLAQAYGLPAPRPARALSTALVATKVPAGVDFTASAPQQSADAPLAMYRHPADKNAATTAVNAGRLIDVTG